MFIIPYVHIIISALNRMVISLNTFDKSLMFAMRSPHVISSVLNRSVISLDTCDKSEVFAIPSVHIISSSLNKMVVSLDTLDQFVMFVISSLSPFSSVFWIEWNSVQTFGIPKMFQLVLTWILKFIFVISNSPCLEQDVTQGQFISGV